jgi:hypothetical protein
MKGVILIEVIVSWKTNPSIRFAGWRKPRSPEFRQQIPSLCFRPIDRQTKMSLNDPKNSRLYVVMLVTGKDSTHIGVFGVNIPAHYLKETEFEPYCLQ